MESKLRIRTKKELENRKECFLEISKILDDLNIFYFIQGGTLLGARREKKFIEWDWDVEISLLYEDLNLNFDKIINKLIVKGFSITYCNKDKQNIKIDCIKDYSEEVSGYTLLGWPYYPAEKKYKRRELNIPQKFLKKYEKITFYNKEFNAPYPIDEYLTYQYGNWKKRLRSSDKKKYMTKNFYKRNNFILEILVVILKKVYGLILKK